MSQEILKFCLEKGLLLDKDILSLFSGIDGSYAEIVKVVIDKLRHQTQAKMITRNLFVENKEKVNSILLDIPELKKEHIEKFKIKMGLSIEVEKEVFVRHNFQDVSKKVLNKEILKSEGVVRVLANPIVSGKCLEVKDFVNYFRNRFREMSGILQQHSELDNLVSINKISGNSNGISIIGFVCDKRITKNNNILLKVEDLTGKIKVLINKNNPEIYEKAEDISLDCIIGFKGSGNREILFANEVVFPDSVLDNKKKAEVEEYVAFIADVHFGSKRFLKDDFLRFIDYLNGKTKDSFVNKIKYLFIVGDLITGVGNYPGQENEISINNVEAQFEAVAELLGKIRKDIKIIISPGNHDAVRLMEPQPLFDEKFAWALYDLPNIIMTGSPCYVNIGAREGFPGFDVLTYHGISFPFYANNVSRLMLQKAMDNPAEIMKYLLKNRHLAPTHTSTQYFPGEDDNLMIKKIPDIFVAGHTHKSDVSYYNNVLVVSTSCWEALTPYQEKFGNNPDHCKVPLFNLKTRGVKILDFERDESVGGGSEEKGRKIVEVKNAN